MKRATLAFAVVFACLILSQAGPSQGISSGSLQLSLNGNWRAAVDIQEDSLPSGVEVFYEQNTGTVLQVRNDYKIRAVTEISKQFSTAGQSGATTEGSQILMMQMFPLPTGYQKEIASKMHDGKVPRLWEVREAGNAEWFYVSQLFGGYRLSGSGQATEVREEYVPLRITHAQHKAAGRGDALIFEAETEKGAPEAAVRHFKLPSSVKDQRLRYGWIQFSPGGIAGSENVVSVAFATPVNSSFNVDTVLESVVKNYGLKAEAKN